MGTGTVPPIHRLGLIVALPQELRTLTPHSLRPGETASLPGGHTVGLSGVGASAAEATAEHLLRDGADLLVSWGTAAGLDPALCSGTLVIPEAVGGADGSVFHPEARARRLLLDSLSLPHDDTLVSEAPTVLADPATKRALRDAQGAVAADMESAAIARVAHARGHDFLVVRAIADPAESRLPSFVLEAIGPSERVHRARLLAATLRRPGEWGVVTGLARHFRAALRALRAAAPALLQL